MSVFSRFAALFAFLSLGTGSVLLGAQVRVDIELPGLKNLPQGSGALTTMLNSQVRVAALEIGSIVNTALDKPLLLGAFGDTLPLSLLPLSQGPSWKGRYFSLSLSSGAALEGDSYAPDVWMKRFDALTPESDFQLGLGVQPYLARFSISLDPLLRGLSIKGFGGYLDYRINGGIELRTWSAGGGFSWLILPAWTPVRGFSWRGLLVDAAFGATSNLVSVRLDLDTIEKSFSFAPSPWLPLSYTVNMKVKPSFDLAFGSEAQALPFQLSTGLTFFDSLSLTLGGGGCWTRGRASLGLSGTQPIDLTIDSALGADFIDESKPGSITMSGSSSGEFATAWRFYAFAALELRAGALYFQIPSVAYSFDRGFSASLGLGISI